LKSTVLDSLFISDYFLFSNKKLLFDVAKKWLLTFPKKYLFARSDDLWNKIQLHSFFDVQKSLLSQK